jgi:hypothetical protein
MNIFILDKDPIKAAQAQCDKHVVKMVIESAQLLCTAHRVLDGDKARNIDKLYHSTHINHPCSIWVRDTVGNYMWLYNHFTALCDEYTYRYNKFHKSDIDLRSTLVVPPKNIPIGKRTYFAEAITYPECRLSNPIDSYRKYYLAKQQVIDMSWTKRHAPAWFIL